mmetsp:Transcript_25999/g.56680  ORF Transcript_25999/g.56680 Transcript_25999/m.56680 type:complete len:222 (-) Transcript_25999:703-1368(-)
MLISSRTVVSRVQPFKAAPVVPARGRGPRTVRVVAGAQISSNDFRNGVAVEVDGVPYKVTEFLHVKPGKGSAFVRTKLKNFLNGTVVEKTFRAGEMVDSADVAKREGQFTYAEGDDYVFMDNETYEETRLKKDNDWAAFLKEGTVCSLMFYKGKVISVEPPSFVDLKIVECPPNVKGNTASGGGTKPATLETGAVVAVPLFIDVDTVIKVDTRTGQYLSKA